MASETVRVTGGKKMDAYLLDIARKLGGKSSVQVGFLEGSTNTKGVSIPMIAAIQNFGAPKVNIPARPFFTNMVIEKSPGWPKTVATLLVHTDYDTKKTLALLGEGIKDQLQQSIHDTNTPPLAEATIARKGFSKPLIDHGDMLNSVGVIVKT